jgi:membrane peptidoglycan carboxypeptidase
VTERRSAFSRVGADAPARRSTQPTTGTVRRQPTTVGQRVSGKRAEGRPPSVQPRGGNGSGPGGPRDTDTPEDDQPRWKRITKGILKWGLIAGLALALIGVILLFVRYTMVKVPKPAEFASAESSTFYYADEETVMGRLGTADREIVALDSLPTHVSEVFVAAEDRSFHTNPGVDIVGTGRAMFNTIIRGERQGGSTITQQYVENYYIGQSSTPSLKEKLDEALIALKLGKEQDKDEILENYINTIYFGRGAYGVQAAARQYFAKDAADLTVSEAAMLAGIIPAPSAWDPRLSPEKAEQRWNYVLDGMVAIGEMEGDDRASQTFPEVAEYASAAAFGGPQGHLLQAAIDELAKKGEITREDIETRGYTIITTIDTVAQQATVDAVNEMPDDHADNLRVAAVTMNPENGAITSMYGGADYLEVQRNAVTQDVAQAGSTFKPFALVAALEDGFALESRFRGDHNMTLDGFDNPVRNFGSVSFGRINLIRATEASVNTVYVQLANEIGAERVRETAVKAGIPEGTLGLEDNPANVLGTASPHPLDMASAYATFAAQGFSTEPFMVSEVRGDDGEGIFEHEVTREQVFQDDVMAETTYALTRVVDAGSGSYARELGRPVAGKTGTANENRSAWFVGYTPEVVGAVALYQVGEDGSAEKITPFGDFDQITGGSVPVRVWTGMMAPILEQYEVSQFPPRAFLKRTNQDPPEPSPEPSPEPEPEPSPEPEPEPEPVPEPEPEPEPVPVPSPDPTITAMLGSLFNAQENRSAALATWWKLSVAARA